MGHSQKSSGTSLYNVYLKKKQQQHRIALKKKLWWQLLYFEKNLNGRNCHQQQNIQNDCEKTEVIELKNRDIAL